MKSSKFMDKKITQLSKTHSFFDDEEDDDDQYVFEPQQLFDQVAGDEGVRASSRGAGLISEIDRRVKEHTDNVVYAVGALSARVLQLEKKTLKLENAIGDLKDSIGFNHGRIEGKIRELGNVLGEVQGGIRDLRDKQDIAEAQLQLQLVKLGLSKDDHKSMKSSADQNCYTEINKSQEFLSSSVPQQSYAQVSVPVSCSQQLSSVPAGATQNLHHNTPSSHAAATAPQLPTPLPLPPSAFPSIPHTAPIYQPAMPTPDNIFQQFIAPVTQQMQQPLPAAPQPYQPGYQSTQQALAFPEKEVIQPQFPIQHPPNQQLPRLQQQHPPNPQLPLLQQQHPPNPQLPLLQQQCPPNPQLPQLQQQHPPISEVNSHTNLPLRYQPKDVPYFPYRSIHNSSVPPPRSPAFHEHFVDSRQRNLDQSPINPFTELPSGYSQPPGHTSLNDQYPYVASSSRFDGSTTKPSQLLPSSSVFGAGSSSSGLPTAKILPHALPTASSVDSGSDSSESGNRIAVDDVIDKVVAMGFRRDLVRATVRKLTANGQSVDFNAVLDKLMNSSDG